ncbi:EAL domain-containing protein [Guyparkeria sp.]|uniref:EAL domain-containing protein n=1 Tax=Guyparkeria sp. TaxID=2035736 RepID=UPI003970989B
MLDSTTQLGTLARRDLIEVAPTEKASAVVRRLQDTGNHCAVIMEDGQPVGIWTAATAAGGGLSDSTDQEHPLRAVMEHDVATLPAGSSIAEARACLKDAAIRHILVCSTDGSVQGRLTREDLTHETSLPNRTSTPPAPTVEPARTAAADDRFLEPEERKHCVPAGPDNPDLGTAHHEHTTGSNSIAPFEQYESLLEASDDMFAVADANYRYLWANPAYCRSQGLSLEEITVRRLPEVLGAEYFERTVKPRLNRSLAGEAQRYETERDHHELGRRKLLIRYFPLAVSDGAERQIGTVITDVTDIRASEAELERQYRLLSMAGRTARFGWWIVDLETNRVEWSDVVAAIHGMPNGYSPSVEAGIAFYAPEYRDRIRKLFTACVEKGEPYDEKLEITDASGQRVWVRTLGEPVRDEHGRIVEIQGAFQDLTSQRERDQELRRLAYITDQSPAPITVTDLNGKIQYVNPAFECISGYRSSELIGHSPALIQGGSTPEQTYRELWETITSGEVWTGELQNRRKDGRAYWEHEVISPLTDEQGQITNYVAIKQDITAVKKAEEELSRIAYEDPLTGLYSRNGFTRHLQQWVDRDGWASHGGLVMVDIIGLRDINDAYGFEEGDRLLIEFAKRLIKQTGEHRCAGRIGGDEFALVLMPTRDESLQECLSRTLDCLSTPFGFNGLDIEISTRMGFTQLGEQQRPVQNLLREAERALFQHREEPSAPWVCYDASLQEEMQNRIDLTRDLRIAINEDQLELHFQPKVNLDHGNLIACEALLRWNHPVRGLMSPDTFIPIAEQSQLIVPIGDWTLHRACQHLRDWRDAGLEPVRVAVNVSVIQFQTGDFASRVRAVLHESGIAPEELALEITESVFERESELLLDQMLRLRDMGVRLSLDDFGTGYSSLLYLKRYPFHEIKIDQGFVFHMLDDRLSRNIVETVMMLAKALDAEVIAEGIESAAVSRELRQMGCHFGQGFYYSMPLEAEDFRWLLEQRSSLPLNLPHEH